MEPRACCAALQQMEEFSSRTFDRERQCHARQTLKALLTKVDTAAMEAERFGPTTAAGFFEWHAWKLTKPNPTRLKVCQGTTRPASQTDRPKWLYRPIHKLSAVGFGNDAVRGVMLAAPRGKGLSPDSSLDRICSADLLSPLLVPRLLLSPLVAHDALIWSIAAPRLTRCCRLGLRLRHALLPMLPIPWRVVVLQLPA